MTTPSTNASTGEKMKKSKSYQGLTMKPEARDATLDAGLPKTLVAMNASTQKIRPQGGILVRLPRMPLPRPKPSGNGNARKDELQI